MLAARIIRAAPIGAINHTDATRYAFTPNVAEQTREIRKRLMREHLSGGFIYIEGGDLVPRNGSDVHHRFRVDSNFAYLTGVHEPGFSALLDADTGTWTLLSPKLPPEAVFWVNRLPSLEEMAEKYGADRCCYTEDLPSLLAAGRKDVHVLPQHVAKLTQVMEGVRKDHQEGVVNVSDSFLEGVLKRCRGSKTDAEVACLLRANEISGRAHMAMWRACTPGHSYEYSLEAAFTHSAMTEGLMSLGYPCIVGSGGNGAILHYDANQRRVEHGDLVLVDAGAEYRCYTADISRTFPASGTFTAFQREVYNAVLSVQECALSHMRPGMTWEQVDAPMRRLLLGYLRDMCLVKGSIDGMLLRKVDRIFMPHGLGHHLGLDVHDVSDTGQIPERLQPGHVVTCEPGIYFIESLVEAALADIHKADFVCADAVRKLYGFGGVRIEDNVLIEHSGSFNITMAAGVPKTANEVCEVMRHAAAATSGRRSRS